MKCPTCNAWTSVLETRSQVRKRQCANGHKFSTKEVLISELKMALYGNRTDQARRTLRQKGYLA